MKQAGLANFFKKSEVKKSNITQNAPSAKKISVDPASGMSTHISMPEKRDIRKTRTLAEVEPPVVDDDDEVELSGVLQDLDQYLDSSESEFQTEPKKLVQKRRKTETVQPEKKSSFAEVEKKKTEPPKTVAAKKPQKIDNKENDVIVDQEDQHIGGGFNSLDEIKEALPEFLQDQNIKDYNGRRPGEEGYDETTLDIPKKYWKDFTGCKIQYWQIKQFNLEKILLFKLGKFYEIFFMDAIVCQKLLDLNWMGGAKKLHVGFPEKALDKYLAILVNNGYKVAVVEQTETPKQLDQRLKEMKKKGQKAAAEDKCVNRDIAEMVTRGTFQNNETGYEPKYILSYKKQGNAIGVTFFDITTLKIHIGEFEEEDESMQKLRTLVCQIRPVEVIQEKDFNTSAVVKMLKNSPVVPTFTNLNQAKCPSMMQTLMKIEQYFGADTSKWPTELLNMKNDDIQLAIFSFGMALTFLEDALISEKTIKTGTFFKYSPESSKINFDNMVLDSQCLQHLEIVEAADGSREGSLLNFVDHCQTHFGKRQIKRWVLTPLMNIDQINERYDAVEDLIAHQYETDAVRCKLKQLPDLEKLLARLYTYSIKHRIKAIYFEDVSLKKLKEFRQVLTTLKQTGDVLSLLMKKKDEFKSNRLRSLLSFEEEGGILPSKYKDEIAAFEKIVIWKKVAGGQNEIPEPRAGIDENFDNANNAVNEVKRELDQELVEIRKMFRNDRQIQFSHAKFRYEIEIPADYVKGKKKPEDWDITSQRKGFERFHNKTIRALVDKLEFAEEALKDAMIPFLCAIFTRFHEQKEMWDKILNVLTEVDCLISLSIASGQQEMTMSRPELIPYEEGSEKSIFDIKQMTHPCVQLSGGKQFIPNDTYMEPGVQGLLLVTGPNMGGKSTILRQNCLAAILAQIGCFVPCESFRLTPVDRIFTRLGASDRILEGKSTFYVEMEETRNVIQFATYKSLAILDELGRGTSTFDGYSIANSVLTYLVDKLKCRCLFSTHYHMLLDDFRNVPGVASYHMSYKANESKDTVTFLYKFIKGECPMSFGINVARMAGIEQKILQNAMKKSKQFELKINAKVQCLKK